MRKKLGLNIDHIATLREARKSVYPEPLQAAGIAEQSGVEGITLHLREDRRHICDRDVYLIRKIIQTKMNLEMALNDEIIKIALDVIPDEVCIVPEKREEVTTEGGLDLINNEAKLIQTVEKLRQKNIEISVFIDPEKKQINKAKELGIKVVEFHTGQYADAESAKKRSEELLRLKNSVDYAVVSGIQANAGHGLNYQNVYEIARLEGIDTLNIGHSIISRAVFTGLENAVKDMLDILSRADIEK